MKDENPTKGVKTLLGNPKKAIIKLSIPMIIAMSAQTLYNLADAIWVSGLGPNSLAAVGFVFPFLFFAMALSNGIGIGGGSAISRKIGEKDKSGADIIASHTIVIMLITVLIISFLMMLFTEPILNLIGAGKALPLAISYAKIIFTGIIFVFFNQISIALLRSEGDAKRAMYLMLSGVVLNILLDPLFIYTLNLGVDGAAYATIFSMFLVSVVTFNLLFIRKQSYVDFKFKGFKLKKSVISEISKVGFPATVSQTSMALMSFLMISIVSKVGGNIGVAVYTTGWRVIALAIMPILGIASAVTSVSGAAFGGKKYEKINTAFNYSIKIGVFAEIILSGLIFIFASQLSWIFTWSQDTQPIQNDLIKFLRIVSLMMITAPIGMVTSAMFQGTGKGIYSLIMTLIRTLVFTVPYAWLLSIYFGWGLTGVWWGMVFSGLTYIPIALIWSKIYIKKLIS